MTASTLRGARDRHTPVLGSMFLSRSDAGFPAVLIATPWPEGTIINTCPQGPTAMWTIIAPHVDRTTANPAGSFDFFAGPAESTAEAIMEIRRRSGLTWQELGKLFDVSRRSIHHWANGKQVSAGNDQTIRRMLAAVRYLDQGEQRDTRAFLLSVDQATGDSPLDLLHAGQFDEATARVQGDRTLETYRIPLSRAAQDARRPPAPTLLLEAVQDRPEIPARSRTVRARRPPRTSD